MSTTDLLNLIYRLQDPRTNPQFQQDQELFYNLQQNPEFIFSLLQILQEQQQPDLRIACIVTIKNVSQRVHRLKQDQISEIAQQAITVMNVEHNPQMLHLMSECLHKILTSLNLNNYQEAFIQIMSQIDYQFSQAELQAYINKDINVEKRRFFILELMLAFYKRRVYLSVKHDKLDSVSEQLSIPFLSQELELAHPQGCKLALRVLTMIYSPIPTRQCFGLLLEGILNGSYKLNHNEDLYQLWLQIITCHRKIGKISEKNRKIEHITYLQAFDAAFPILFQTILDSLQKKSSEKGKFNQIALLMQSLQFVIDSTNVQKLDETMIAQLIQFSNQLMEENFEANVNQESLQLEKYFDNQSESDVTLFSPLYSLSISDSVDLTDAIVKFWQVYYRHLSVDQIMQSSKNSLQQAQQAQTPQKFYINVIHSVVSLCQQRWVCRNNQIDLTIEQQQDLSTFGLTLRNYFVSIIQQQQQLPPAYVCISLWALDQISNDYQDILFTLQAASVSYAMIPQSRTVSEFAKLIKFTINRFDEIKRSLCDINVDQMAILDPTLLEIGFQIMIQFNPSFSYYPEINDLLRLSCEIFSISQSDLTSKIFGSFFQSYVQQQGLQLTQLVDIMMVFSKIFIWKEAEVSEFLYSQYLDVIYQVVSHFIHNYSDKNYTEMETISIATQQLMANASSVDNFLDNAEKLFQLFQTCVQFVIVHGDGNCNLLAGAIFAIADVFAVNEHGQSVSDYCVQLVKSNDVQDNLLFLLRLIAGHCLQNQIDQIAAQNYLQLFIRPVNLDKTDIHIDILMSSVYIFIFALSCKCEFDLLEVEDQTLIALKNYLPAHIRRSSDNSHFNKSFLNHFFQFAQQFQKYEDIIQFVQNRSEADKMQQKLMNRVELNIPEMNQIYVKEDNDLLIEMNQGEVYEVPEMRGIMEKIRLLSIEMSQIIDIAQ
ncbi:Conserved_hypothetical protein [Hexamita inflata]|uniref:Uncharacterized protein n=1 Tax=Hexamita inflata TaxID=28002 RepID=A0AA86UCD4_9EUKA|nr:Conserved hypothetical protein [Hexamita inflata]